MVHTLLAAITGSTRNSAESLIANNGALKTNNGFAPRTYIGEVATSTTAAATAFTAGNTAVMVTNKDAAIVILVALGTSAGNANTNAADGVAVMPGATVILHAAEGETHYSLDAESGTPNAQVVEG